MEQQNRRGKFDFHVTYSCGHSGWVRLVGKVAARCEKLNFLETEGLCPECLGRLKGQRPNTTDGRGRTGS